MKYGSAVLWEFSYPIARAKAPSNRGQLSYTDETTGKTYLFRLTPYNSKL